MINSQFISLENINPPYNIYIGQICNNLKTINTLNLKFYFYDEINSEFNERIVKNEKLKKGFESLDLNEKIFFSKVFDQVLQEVIYIANIYLKNNKKIKDNIIVEPIEKFLTFLAIFDDKQNFTEELYESKLEELEKYLENVDFFSVYNSNIKNSGIENDKEKFKSNLIDIIYGIYGILECLNSNIEKIRWQEIVTL